MRFDRKAMREKLLQRHKESYEKKDDSGKFKSIFKKLPEKVSFWKVSEDEHIVDHIPYISSKNNPNVPADEPVYWIDVWVHRGVGPAEDSFVCPQRMFKKPCPVCELQKSMKEQEEFDEDAVKKLSPTRRAIYNIWVRDSIKEQEKGIQLWDASHYLYENPVAALAKLPKEGGFVPYTNPDIGKSVSFRRSGKGALSTKYTAFRFLERDEPIPDSILESAVCIEDYIHFADYKEIEGALFGKTMNEEEESETLPEPEKEKAPKEERKRRTRGEVNPCPYNHKFGIDIEKFEDCQKCEKWDACSEKADELENEKDIPDPEPVKEEPPAPTRRRRIG
jgi:hypothetical protein